MITKQTVSSTVTTLSHLISTTTVSSTQLNTFISTRHIFSSSTTVSTTSALIRTQNSVSTSKRTASSSRYPTSSIFSYTHSSRTNTTSSTTFVTLLASTVSSTDYAKLNTPTEQVKRTEQTRSFWPIVYGCLGVTVIFMLTTAILIIRKLKRYVIIYVNYIFKYLRFWSLHIHIQLLFSLNVVE